MEDKLAKIQEKKISLDKYRPFPKVFRDNMDEWYKIELTYTSNAIEGNTLTRQETALVVEKGITIEGKSITEHLEAINHAKAFEYINSLHLKSVRNITEYIILNIHALILQNIDMHNAGRYRAVPVRIAGSSVVMPNPLKVPNLMSDFVLWLRKTKQDPVEMAVDAHFKLVSIHPFSDGNGRTARLLMNLILMTYGYPPTIIRKEDRKQYIESIEKGQLTENLSDYYSFMFKSIERSLDIYTEALEPKQKKKSTVKKLMKIGELAKATGETVPTIRFWTKEGLLTVVQFSAGGYQLYSPDAIERIKKIRRLKSEKRLTIQELKKSL